MATDSRGLMGCRRLGVWALGALGAAAWALVGCGGGDSVTVVESGAGPALGRLSVPLDTTGSSGALYRLSGSLLMMGPQEETILLSGAVPSVEAQLASGSYQATLLDPWRLSRVDADRPRAVDAVLTSENPAAVQIEPNLTTHLVLRFRVEGGDVVPADGEISVSIEVDDTPTGGGACDESSAGQCVEQLLDNGLLALGAAPSCVPAQTLPTPLGDVQVCGTGVCADGSPGCAVDGLSLQAATQVLQNGPIRIGASAALLTPLVVPIRLPPQLGGSICRPEVSASFPGLVVTLNRIDVGAGKVGLEVGAFSLGPSSIDIQGGGVCEVLFDVLLGPLRQQLEARLRELILDGLPGLVESLTCTECPDGCALRCLSNP